MEISAMTLWSEQWCGLQWLVNFNSGLRPKLSRLVSVFGHSERVIQKMKQPNMPLCQGVLEWSRGAQTPTYWPAPKFSWLDLMPNIDVHITVPY